MHRHTKFIQFALLHIPYTAAELTLSGIGILLGLGLVSLNGLISKMFKMTTCLIVQISDIQYNGLKYKYLPVLGFFARSGTCLLLIFSSNFNKTTSWSSGSQL